MTPVFANSAHVRVPERIVVRKGKWRPIDLRVRYGLCLHPDKGPVLIDTGYTAHALHAGQRSLALRLYGSVLSPRLVPENQPEVFLRRFSLSPADVNLVVLTHFHADHVSGLQLFPNARFIADADAWRRIASCSRVGQLRHGVFSELIPPDFSRRLEPLADCAGVDCQRYGFSGKDLLGDGSMIAVDLPGHAAGHFGILFPRQDPPLFYAVDAQWVHAALSSNRRPGFPASLIAHDAGAQADTTRLLQGLEKQGVDVLLCHDPAMTHHDSDGKGGVP
ncbi:MBL fold metallo-hydrolase [Breoghania sp.]|uniref:MBL fold metallo-hydrolase n=1 Tax=Breoghania sp. TaxID=2065378 RepID=UPI002AAAF8E5|nr:MBL fold metallo-hydrolase [Breoghania sp.]